MEEDNKGPRPLLVKMNSVEETELVMTNLKNLEDVGPEVQNLRISPDRSLKKREEVRVLVIKAKHLNTSETRDYKHIVRDKEILRVRKNKGPIRTRWRCFEYGSQCGHINT